MMVYLLPVSAYSSSRTPPMWTGTFFDSRWGVELSLLTVDMSLMQLLVQWELTPGQYLTSVSLDGLGRSSSTLLTGCCGLLGHVRDRAKWFNSPQS